MESSELNPAQVTKSSEIIKTPIKKPEDVIGFLREFNFGSRDESARTAVERFLLFINEHKFIDSRLLPGEPRFTDLIIDELEKAGFVEPGTISHEEWTQKAEQALGAALQDFEERAKEWQIKVSKTHQHWGP